MDIKSFVVEYEGCSYLEGKKRKNLYHRIEGLRAWQYEDLLSQCYRRSGRKYYRNICESCQACIPLRIKVKDFNPSRSQRKILKNNQDVSHEFGENTSAMEYYAIYNEYAKAIHGETAESYENFAQFLGEGENFSRAVVYKIGTKLVGVSWIDVLPNGLSSVYFAYEPAMAKRSLGYYSILKEIELTKEMGKSYYYLGFWVKGCAKMEYKSKFDSQEILLNGNWVAKPRD